MSFDTIPSLGTEAGVSSQQSINLITPKYMEAPSIQINANSSLGLQLNGTNTGFSPNK